MKTVMAEKWQRVDVGHLIPAGQPYLYEFVEDSPGRHGVQRAEYVSDSPVVARPGYPVYVDSTWRPPVDLPIEPTWGFGIWRGGATTWIARWEHRGHRLVEANGHTPAGSLVDFIPLTPEQIDRIEAKEATA